VWVLAGLRVVLSEVVAAVELVVVAVMEAMRVSSDDT